MAKESAHLPWRGHLFFSGAPATAGPFGFLAPGRARKPAPEFFFGAPGTQRGLLFFPAFRGAGRSSCPRSDRPADLPNETHPREGRDVLQFKARREATVPEDVETAESIVDDILARFDKTVAPDMKPAYRELLVQGLLFTQEGAAPPQGRSPRPDRRAQRGHPPRARQTGEEGPSGREMTQLTPAQRARVLEAMPMVEARAARMPSVAQGRL
ncbi:MAG: hypothetical protein IPG04_12610 [Polyangiaceae bacterium]|nr:hypothetical protein [Polyangiaceae bacterium]